MLKWDSIPGAIVDFAFCGLITPVLCDEIVHEYREVLLRSKFHLTDRIVSDVIEALQEHAEFIDPKHIDLSIPDPDDAIFYEITLDNRKAGETYLVTGNLKHFPVDRYVVSPRQFFDIISRRLAQSENNSDDTESE